MGFKTKSQVMTQTYIDPCDLKTYVVTIPFQSNSGVLVIIRDKSKSFTYSQFTSGEVSRWINGVFSTPCPSTVIVSQTVTQSVTQAASTTASSAASSSSQGEGGSSESKSDEKKEEKKSENKKKSAPLNPMMIASDLTTTQGPDFKYNVIASFGVSQSSLIGTETWSANSMIWSSLNQFVLSGGYTKMGFSKGKLSQIHSYSITAAYLEGNYMGLLGYTHIKPNPKYGTYGYNLGLITLLLNDIEIDEKTEEIKDVVNMSLSSSVVVFWTKPFTVNNKIILSPQVFLMNSPIAWNSKTGETTVNRELSFLVGSSFDYRLSKRFGLSLNYKVAGSSESGSPLLSNFLIGSRVIL